MSAEWSLTYFQTDQSEQAVFSAIVDVFERKLNNRLFAYNFGNSSQSELSVIQLQPMIVEQFNDQKRATMIINSLSEFYAYGVLVYSPRDNLYAIADTIVCLGAVFQSGRTRRKELIHRLQTKFDPFDNSALLYSDFLKELSTTLHIEAAHIMFQRNAAGRATGVHFYENGTFIDSYYVENIECIGEYGLIELPEHPKRIATFLDGRFAFLNYQPMIKRLIHKLEVDEYEDYFDGEDLHKYLSIVVQDSADLQRSDLYLPFGEDELPFGAVYCLARDFPDYFVQQYD